MLYNIMYFFLLFIIYAIIGWIVEGLTVLFKTKKWSNRGFLLGPYCPIYGFGALMMIFVLSRYKDDPINLFIMFAVYASILEYITSYLMEKLFNARWWDYSHYRFNLNGRVCLINSLLFGALGMFMAYLLNPFITHLLSNIPHNALIITAIIILIGFLTDVVVTFRIVSKIKKSLILLNKDMTDDINKQIINFIENNHIFKAFPLLNKKLNK